MSPHSKIAVTIESGGDAANIPPRDIRKVWFPMRNKSTPAPCSVEGCDVTVYCRGWCRTHYERWLKYGDPQQALRPKGEVERRLWSKIDKNGPGGCWLWTASKSEFGYGSFCVNARTVLAHRVVYELLVGPIPDGLQLDHFVCDNPSCVNPDHLRPVTGRANTLRGRGPTAENARKTACPAGHPYDEENTYISRSGKRHCRECGRIEARERMRRNRVKLREVRDTLEVLRG